MQIVTKPSFSIDSLISSKPFQKPGLKISKTAENFLIQDIQNNSPHMCTPAIPTQFSTCSFPASYVPNTSMYESSFSHSLDATPSLGIPSAYPSNDTRLLYYTLLAESQKFMNPFLYNDLVLSENRLHAYNNYDTLKKIKRVRTAFSPSQLIKLEDAFDKNQYVVGSERKELAEKLTLSETQVKVWFQNRRTKYKRDKCESKEGEEEEDVSEDRKCSPNKKQRLSLSFDDSKENSSESCPSSEN